MNNIDSVNYWFESADSDYETIDKNVLKSINRFIEEKKKYNVTTIILFGSYAKETANEDRDINIAVISDDFEDIYDCMAILMGMTCDIDAKIEPHPIATKEYKNVTDPFIKEVIDTGIKVA